MKKNLIGLLLLGYSFIVVADDYYQAIHAYYDKNYNEARNFWLSTVKNTPYQQNKAEYGLALLYWQGKAVEQDYQQAETWLLKAVSGDISEAKVKLAHLYLKGLTGTKKPDFAKTLLTEAAKQGNRNAQYHLGLINETELNQGNSRYWLRKSAHQGDKRALDKLRRMEMGQPLASVKMTHNKEMINKMIVLPHDKKPLIVSMNQSAPLHKVKKISSQTASHSPEWLKTQNLNNYATQIIAVSSMNSVNKMVAKYPLKPWAYWTKQKNGKTIYVMVLCCFETKTEQPLGDLKKFKPYHLTLKTLLNYK